MLAPDDAFPKITVILRGSSLDEARLIAQQMRGLKIHSMEVSLVTDGALETISKLHHEFEDEILVGAGTVLTAEQAKRSVDAGASFLLSPICFTQDIFDVARDADVITVPSGLTPTEIHTMLLMGADIVKVFPAARLTPAYLHDLRAPLGDMPLMVVGGVNADNVQEYFSAGAKFAGIGSGCFEEGVLERMDAKGVRTSLVRLQNSVDW